MIEPWLYETHVHTPLCRHAEGDLDDYAHAAFQRGFHGLIVTCHAPMPEGFSPTVRMRVDEFDDYLSMVFRAQRHWQGKIDIRLGIEAEYFPGFERWVEHQLQSADFQYVLGSVHPQMVEFKQRFWTGDPVEFQRAYFQILADAAETGLYDCLAHPDGVKNETPDAWDPQAVMDDVCRALDRIAATGMAMELNTSGAEKIVPEMNPFPAMLKEMCKRSIPVVIGADAHRPDRVGHRFGEALDLAESCGYRCVSFFVGRTRHEVPVAAARKAISCRTTASARMDWGMGDHARSGGGLEQPTWTDSTRAE